MAADADVGQGLADVGLGNGRVEVEGKDGHECTSGTDKARGRRPVPVVVADGLQHPTVRTVDAAHVAGHQLTGRHRLVAISSRTSSRAISAQHLPVVTELVHQPVDGQRPLQARLVGDAHGCSPHTSAAKQIAMAAT